MLVGEIHGFHIPSFVGPGAAYFLFMRRALVKDRRRRIRTKSHLIVRDCNEETGIYPSDHYPVLAELAMSADDRKVNDRGEAGRSSDGPY